jgi:hypothetical protein
MMDAENGWRATFLSALEASGNVSASARRAGMHRGTAYRYRQADPEFRAAWDEALEVAADALEAEVRRRAVDGWDEPVFYDGKVCGYIRRYDDRLLMFLMKAYRPEFRDHAPVRSTGDQPEPVRVEYPGDWPCSPDALQRPALPSPSAGPAHPPGRAAGEAPMRLV